MYAIYTRQNRRNGAYICLVKKPDCMACTSGPQGPGYEARPVPNLPWAQPTVKSYSYFISFCTYLLRARNRAAVHVEWAGSGVVVHWLSILSFVLVSTMKMD